MTGADSQDARRRLEAVVHGRVQAVGFRVFVARRAATLDLVGWVANEANGTVRVVAEGPEGALRTLLATLEDGPSGARVDRVDEAWMAASEAFHDFDIRSGWHRGD